MQRLLSLVLFVFLLTSCNVINPIHLTATPALLSGKACIPPLDSFAFSLSGGERTGPKPYDQLPPSDEWQFITAVPRASHQKVLDNGIATLDTIQTIEGKDAIWVRITGEHTKLARYQINNNQWQDVDIRPENAQEELEIGVSPILATDKNNFVWLPRNRGPSIGLEMNTPVLSVYNEKNGKFKTILTIKDFLGAQSITQINRIDIADVQMDSKGNFWLILSFVFDGKNQDYQLFSFSPSTHQLKRYLTNLEYSYLNNASFVISPSDVIFLLDGEKNTLIQYSISNDKSKTINIPDQIILNSNQPNPNMRSANLFLDSHQRLWIDDRGWLDLSPQGDWHIVIRSPIFIYYMYYGSGTWSWLHPTFSRESIDGRLWYSSLRGTGWVNPKTAEWCMFTTYPSNVVKDSDGNLWIIADGNLYKYSLKPR